jgi:hypothetical protein
MQHIRGSVLQCSRFGCIVRLDDGRLATLPSSERSIDLIRRALSAGRSPQFPFVITEESGRRVRVAIAASPEPVPASAAATPPARFSSSLEQKIIDFWRQVSEWDRNAGRVDEEEPMLRHADRLLPFEDRAPRQYRDSPKRPRRPKPKG